MPLPSSGGYFRFKDAICYGRLAARGAVQRADGRLVDVARQVSANDGRLLLPFDLGEVVENLRCERYPLAPPGALDRVLNSEIVNRAYYFVRPLLGVAVRKHLQKVRLGGWRRIGFPGWPVDTTVETLMGSVVGALLKQRRVTEFPFIWYWPHGAAGCVMMTHDVEGPSGAAFVPRLMDIDRDFGIPSAFQLVPEASYSRGLLDVCRARGFEVNVHDFNHDGHLFRDRALFDQRVGEINRYAREYGSRGFRSGAMYRRQDWFQTLEVAYDMSVPNVAHFEPQQGGCCTVMPHFIGDVLELPLTTTQDYALFHYLGEYSTDLWRAQVQSILKCHGLVSFIAHPDYLSEPRACDVYLRLLEDLVRLRGEQNVWFAPPGEIDRWWRQRREMRLVHDGHTWRVEGPGSDRAHVAYARLDGDETVCAIAAA